MVIPLCLTIGLWLKRVNLMKHFFILAQVGYEEKCSDNQYVEQKDDCNTWSLTYCPDPCLVTLSNLNQVNSFPSSYTYIAIVYGVPLAIVMSPYCQRHL
jgi:hypothetical protein